MKLDFYRMEQAPAEEDPIEEVKMAGTELTATHIADRITPNRYKPIEEPSRPSEAPQSAA